jgi:hypothetical protein
MRRIKELLGRYWEWLNDSRGYHDAETRLWVVGAPLMLLLAILMLWLFQ